MAFRVFEPFDQFRVFSSRLRVRFHDWILHFGSWNDAGVWRDAREWKDEL
jgi:hypothetical protein